MLFIQGKYDESIDIMKKRLDKCEDEYTAKTYFYLGSDYLKKEVPDSSKQFFKNAYEKDTLDFLSLISLADAYAKLAQNDSAITTLGFVLEMTMLDTTTYGWLAHNAYAKLCNLHYSAKDYTKLKTVAQDWVKFRPEAAIGYLYIATYYQSIKNVENACSFYKLVIKYDQTKKLAPIAKEQMENLGCP